MLGGERTQGVGLVIPDNPDKWYISIGDAATATNESKQWERSTVSMLGRVLYNYKGRYLFNGSFRRDGSSAFSYTGNQWQNFYSVGAGWLMSEEEFMKDITWLDMLKLKGSWGTLGNSEFGQGLSCRTVAHQCLFRRIRQAVRHLSGLPVVLPAQSPSPLGKGGSLGSGCRSQLLPHPPALRGCILQENHQRPAGGSSGHLRHGAGHR